MSEVTKLCCPTCGTWEDLYSIENQVGGDIQMKLGDVTPEHTEFVGTPVVSGDLLTIGVSCANCGFRHIGDDWKATLTPVKETR